MDPEFEKMLGKFKTSMLEYKVSGSTSARESALVFKKWLDEYIITLNKAAEKDTIYITNFVKEYSKTNPELVKMHEQLKKVREQGPKLQDTLETEQLAEKEVPVEMSSYYVKFGLLGTVLAIAAVAALFP
jgi:hypothetical protein